MRLKNLYCTGNCTMNRYVGYWLLGNSSLVAGMVVLGGWTRLTESGLSMVTWSPMGEFPPINTPQWNSYFEKYKKSPEYILKNDGMSMSEFKRIYYMEYAHRQLGRIVGAAYLLPTLYLTLTRKVSLPLALKLYGLTALVGGQGLLGWYMVKSGLNSKLIEDKADARVSPYRLASHLISAFTIYGLTLTVGLKLLKRKPPMGTPLLKTATVLTTGLAATTIISGAFVAGLDAGKIHNTFPKMGNNWTPDGMLYLEPKWKNLFENPGTVQFTHRCLGMLTGASVLLLWLRGRKNNAGLSRHLKMPVHATALQIGLGVTTLLNHVPVPLASLHQANSLVVFTSLLVLLGAM